MTVTLIAAAAANGVIGIENRLPWKLPADMAYFVEQTRGKPVLMGRKTFESLGRPLKNRLNIILSRSMEEAPEGCEIVRSLEEAMERFGNQELMVIGGEEVYRQALPFADRVLLTEIGLEFEGDAFFPQLDPSEWVLESRREGILDEKNTLPHAFLVYRRSRGD
jgi:dihydrofolate reductase